MRTFEVELHPYCYDYISLRVTGVGEISSVKNMDLFVRKYFVECKTMTRHIYLCIYLFIKWR